MNGSQVKRIALSGRLRGGAVLREECGGETLVELSLRGVPAGAALFTVGEGGILRTELGGARVKVGQSGICAAAVAFRGAVIASGFAGSCLKDRSRLMDELRIRAAQEEKTGTPPVKLPETPSEGTKPKSAPAPEARAPSAVTQGILLQAERLFGALSRAGMGPGVGPGGAEPPAALAPTPNEQPEPDREPVRNPFPKTFPGSSWSRRPGEEVLEGEVYVRGKRRRAFAFPGEIRGRSLSFGGQGRKMVSSEGKSYYVVLE